MTADTFTDWLNRIADGKERATLAGFARSALGELPLIPMRVAQVTRALFDPFCSHCFEPVNRCRCQEMER